MEIPFYFNKYIKKHEVDDIHHLGTTKYPSAVEEMHCIEKDLLGIMDILQFKRTKTSFQKELLAKVNEIKKIKILLIMGDKEKDEVTNFIRKRQTYILIPSTMKQEIPSISCIVVTRFVPYRKRKDSSR